MATAKQKIERELPLQRISKMITSRLHAILSFTLVSIMFTK